MLTERAPQGLHLPQFTYNEQRVVQAETLTESQYEGSLSQGFAFSTLFRSSPLAASSSINVSALRQKAPTPAKSALQEDPSAAFIGFSWGPARDVFPSLKFQISSPLGGYRARNTPQSARVGVAPHLFTPHPASTESRNLTTPLSRCNTFCTPNNHPYVFTPFRTNTLPRSASRTVQRRDLSDREAMKQLVDCIGMSARKKVLESGRKPRILNNPTSLRSRSGYGSVRKELRFVCDPIPMPDYRSLSHASASLSSSVSGSNVPFTSNMRNISNPLDTSLYPITIPSITGSDNGASSSSSEPDTELTESEGPPSPSPRPASVLSMSLSLPQRNGTPTTTMMMPTMMIGNLSSSTRSNTTASMLLSRSGSGSSMSVTPGTLLADFPSILLSQAQSKDPRDNKVTCPQEQDDQVISQLRIPDARPLGMTCAETQTKGACDHIMPFKQRNFNAVRGLKKEMLCFTQNECDRWEGTNHRTRLDEDYSDYSSLEQKLDLLMKDISDIEEKLKKVRLAF